MPPFPVHALLVAALAGVPQAPLDVEVVRSESAPAVLLHRQAGPLVALRLSAEGGAVLPEGSVELLQELARPRLRDEAARLGARLELRHEGAHGVIALTGPVEAFDALAGMLVRAASDAPLDVAALRQARARAESRVLGRLEQPGPRVERLLRSALAGVPAPEGFAAGMLGPDDVRALRDRLYDRSAVRLVVVGAVSPDRLREAFGSWPVARGPVRALPGADSTEVRARPQAHRERVGVGLPFQGEPALLETGAELVRRRLEEGPFGAVTAEVWRVDGAGALGLMAAAATDSADVDGQLLGAVTAAAGADDAAVAAARRAVRDRLLLAARTAAGRAEIIGRLADREGSADAAAALLRALESVRPDDVRAALERARRSARVRVEATP